MRSAREAVACFAEKIQKCPASSADVNGDDHDGSRPTASAQLIEAGNIVWHSCARKKPGWTSARRSRTSCGESRVGPSGHDRARGSILRGPAAHGATAATAAMRMGEGLCALSCSSRRTTPTPTPAPRSCEQATPAPTARARCARSISQAGTCKSSTWCGPARSRTWRSAGMPRYATSLETVAKVA